MKKHLFIFFVVCLVVFACTTQEKSDLVQEETGPSGVQFVKLSLNDALIQAQEQGRPIIVDFFSDT